MFFCPWGYQPHECYCLNTERVALQRRLPEDDQWAARSLVTECLFFFVRRASVGRSFRLDCLLCLFILAAHHSCISRCRPAQVVPHNIYLTMYSPSSVNVLAFDPEPEQNNTTHETPHTHS